MDSSSNNAQNSQQAQQNENVAEDSVSSPVKDAAEIGGDVDSSKSEHSNTEKQDQEKETQDMDQVNADTAENGSSDAPKSDTNSASGKESMEREGKAVPEDEQSPQPDVTDVLGNGELRREVETVLSF